MFGDLFLLFQDNKTILKKVPGHYHNNTIYKPVYCVLKSKKRLKIIVYGSQKRICEVSRIQNDTLMDMQSWGRLIWIATNLKSDSSPKHRFAIIILP